MPDQEPSLAKFGGHRWARSLGLQLDLRDSTARMARGSTGDGIQKHPACTAACPRDLRLPQVFGHDLCMNRSSLHSSGSSDPRRGQRDVVGTNLAHMAASNERITCASSQEEQLHLQGPSRTAFHPGSAWHTLQSLHPQQPHREQSALAASLDRTLTPASCGCQALA